MNEVHKVVEETLLNLLKTLNSMCDRLNINYNDDFDIRQLEEKHSDNSESEEDSAH
jgi:chorismate-pyruvate lyase